MFNAILCFYYLTKNVLCQLSHVNGVSTLLALQVGWIRFSGLAPAPLKFLHILLGNVAVSDNKHVLIIALVGIV